MLSVFFLEYSARFDTLSRSILYYKLERYDRRGISLVLIKACFTNKSHYVRRDVAKSSTRCQEVKVIQGSKIGIFFDTYSSYFARFCTVVCSNNIGRTYWSNK